MVSRMCKGIRLLLYFAVLKHLPPTYYPAGKIIKMLRYLCCRNLFLFCGQNVTIESNAFIPFHKVEIGENS